MSAPTSRDTLVRLRQAVASRQMTTAQAAASIGIPRGTLCSRWRLLGVVESMPIQCETQTRQQVAALIEDRPALSDGELSDLLRSQGVSLNRSSVRGHRVALGIPPRNERMRKIDPTWRPSLTVTDAQLIEARRMVETRESTIRRQATHLGVAVETLYHEWRRLGVIHSRPRGLAKDSQPQWCRRAPVRSEVAVHMREYPWMTAQDIADSMTADGYPIARKTVSHHMRTARILGLV
jgi:hypothetical protein